MAAVSITKARREIRPLLPTRRSVAILSPIRRLLLNLVPLTLLMTSAQSTQSSAILMSKSAMMVISTG
jgi:hypothetical protein